MLKSKKQKVSKVFPLPSKLVKEAQKFVKLVRSSKSILISSTLTSDGDSIGAQLGIVALIRGIQKGKKAQITIIDQTPVPRRYQFLEGSENILSLEDWKALKKKPSFDLGVVCDGGIERTGAVEELFKEIPRCVLIDHHAFGSNRKYDANILDLTSSSSCELVYHLFEYSNLTVRPAVAEALYIGIVFDTGFFKHSLTTPRTHFVASKLVETGIDFSKISDRAILDRTWQAQLLLKSMLEKIERSADGKIISSYWTADELRKINSRDGDQEGMINQLYYTEGCEVVVLFVEKEEGGVKISFRSKGLVNVAQFARSLTSHGGGHIRAAGCTMEGSLSDIRTDVLQKLAATLDGASASASADSRMKKSAQG